MSCFSRFLTGGTQGGVVNTFISFPFDFILFNSSCGFEKKRALSVILSTKWIILFSHKTFGGNNDSSNIYSFAYEHHVVQVRNPSPPQFSYVCFL